MRRQSQVSPVLRHICPEILIRINVETQPPSLALKPPTTAHPIKRPKSALSSAPNDRYQALQKKLEDLERVHLEGKKTVC
jgi:hypothetical protein